MAIVLFNPTDDDFEATYGGSTFTIPKCGEDGHMVRVDDAKGNHLLNQLGPRGLTSLDYGDEDEIKEKKAKDGLKRNRDFKFTQIARYNRDNEARRHRQLEFIDPPNFIKEWAKDLGIKLEAPYELSDIKNEEIAQLREKDKRQSKTIDNLTSQVSELMATVKKLLPKEEEDTKTDGEIKAEETIDYIKRMNRQTFRPWVEGLKQSKYGLYPIEVQDYIREKWEGFFDKEEQAFPY